MSFTSKVKGLKTIVKNNKFILKYKGKRVFYVCDLGITACTENESFTVKFEDTDSRPRKGWHFATNLTLNSEPIDLEDRSYYFNEVLKAFVPSNNIDTEQSKEKYVSDCSWQLLSKCNKVASIYNDFRETTYESKFFTQLNLLEDNKCQFIGISPYTIFSYHNIEKFDIFKDEKQSFSLPYSNFYFPQSGDKISVSIFLDKYSCHVIRLDSYKFRFSALPRGTNSCVGYNNLSSILPRMNETIAKGFHESYFYLKCMVYPLEGTRYVAITKNGYIELDDKLNYVKHETQQYNLAKDDIYIFDINLFKPYTDISNCTLYLNNSIYGKESVFNKQFIGIPSKHIEHYESKIIASIMPVRPRPDNIANLNYSLDKAFNVKYPYSDHLLS